MEKQYAIHHRKHLPGVTAFKFMDEQGLPIDIIVSCMAAKGFVICWDDFFLTAAKSANFKEKASLERLHQRVIDACTDVYIPLWFDIWCEKEPDNYKVILNNN